MRRPWRGRLFVSLWVVFLAATCGGSLARAGEVVPGAWGGPQVLASGEPARSPVLAVTAGGQAIVGWLGGPAPPPVSVHPSAPPRSTESSSSSWAGQTVFVDRGTLAGGFQAPIAIAGPLREYLQLSVAVSGTGTTYAVWHVFAGSGMVSAAPPGGSFSAPRELAPAGDELVAVVQSPGGPVAAVWAISERGSGAPLLRYALLGAHGGLGPAVSVGRVLVPPSGVHFALNDSGELAVVGITNNGGGFPRKGPTSTVLVTCSSAARRCSRPHPVQVGAIGHTEQQVEDSLALSEDGTLTVLADANSEECPPKARPCGGFWAVTRPRDGGWLRARKLASKAEWGDLLEAVSDGQGDALALYSGLWWGLKADGARITAPARPAQPAGYAQAGSPLTLAANSQQLFLMTWCTYPAAEAEPLVVHPCNQVAAALGSDDHLETAQPLLPATNAEVGSPEGAVDGAGEVAVIWNEDLEETPGTPEYRLAIDIHRP
jgi:hypothetical protein